MHLRSLLALVAIMNVAGAAHAQHADIMISVVNEQLTIDQSLYLADFRGGLVNVGDSLELSNPGYATQGANVLEPDALLSFEIVAPLLFSDGNNWRRAEHGTYFELFRPSIDSHSVVVTGQSTSQVGFPLAQADDRGTLHEHIRFLLGNHAEGPPPVGAYGVQKVLTSPELQNSTPYMLVFNNGLDTADFIKSIIAARQVISDSPFDCTDDGLLMADDLVCVSDIEQRDNVLRSIGSVVGDLDGDGNVAFSDFLTLSRNFGSDVTSYAAGNIDLVDGVGFPDFLALSQNFGFVGHNAIAIVPEPADSTTPLIAIVYCLLLGPSVVHKTEQAN